MTTPKYPLEEIAEIKRKRLEEAEKMLREKKEHLKKEEEKLKTCEKKRDEVRKHKYDKLRQYYDELDKGTTSDKMEIHERYLKKVVEEELKAEEKKVLDQKKLVKIAEDEVVKAKNNYLQRNQDVEKLKLHEKEWEKTVLLEEIKREALETDELGSSTHVRKKKERDRK